MKVSIVDKVSDHRRSYETGDVCDLPEDQAARWIEQGLAVAVAEVEPAASEDVLEADAAALEAAALADAPEHAVLPRARKR